MGHINKIMADAFMFDNSQKNVDLMNTEYNTDICVIIGVQKSNNVEYNYW